MTLGLTLGWLVAIALVVIAAAKAQHPEPRRPSLMPKPFLWMSCVAAAFGSLQIGRALNLLPTPDNTALSATQVVLWSAGILGLPPVVGRVRSARRWDYHLAPLVVDLLPQLTVIQRRSADTATGALLETSRSAAFDGQGLRALKGLCEAAERIEHHQSPGTDEWVALYGRLTDLRGKYKV
ncbi:hypothetical protein [Streptomyces aureoversilis]|uniref:Uncharacterized protein n=1 Tax=Streptomyces aureoversilis TaxID=67277 RepID=A0ABW0AA76_9ACTN